MASPGCTRNTSSFLTATPPKMSPGTSLYWILSNVQRLISDTKYETFSSIDYRIYKKAPKINYTSVVCWLAIAPLPYFPATKPILAALNSDHSNIMIFFCTHRISALRSLSALPPLSMKGTPSQRSLLMRSTAAANVGVTEP